MEVDNRRIVSYLKDVIEKGTSKMKYSFNYESDAADRDHFIKECRKYIEKEIRDYLAPGDYKINIFSSDDPVNSQVIQFTVEVIRNDEIYEIRLENKEEDL